MPMSALAATNLVSRFGNGRNTEIGGFRIDYLFNHQ